MDIKLCPLRFEVGDGEELGDYLQRQGIYGLRQENGHGGLKQENGHQAMSGAV